MADHTDSFIREVQDELRREQVLRLWERYGTYAITVVVLLVLCVAGYKYFEYQRVSTAERFGARYEAAMQLQTDGKSEEAQQAFAAIAKGASPAYATLASLQLAGAKAKAGDAAQAVSDYEAVANGQTGVADPLLRDYATLQAAMLRLDSADWTEMQNRLNDLTNDQNPWHASARELLGLAAYKAGKTDEARKTFEQLLGDKSTPPSMVERVQLMLNVMTAARIQDGGGAGASGDSGASDVKSNAKEGSGPASTKTN